MRRFLAGLLIGAASMYWYAYQSDAFFGHVKGWLAEASYDPDAKTKVDHIFSLKR
jgi:hypothetical protein